MKLYILTFLLLLIASTSFSQPPKKTVAKEKPEASSKSDKAMEEAMKGMSEEDKAEMRKMVKEVMPDMMKETGPDPVSFTDNKSLVPSRDALRINNISKKTFTDADITTNAALLYTKLAVKIKADEKAIISRVLTQTHDGSSLMSAAVTCLMQGHYQASMGLAMKAVLADPKNVTYQSNLAAILSQSGYPENAIPLLKKLSAQFPRNSTVLNNLGYAWLSLGEIDTARRYLGYAAMRNPNNPETQLCRGFIEELKGDPKKAADNYVESFEELPNPFTETMAKNVKAGDRLNEIDFEKIKSRITIYEYFKKDWIKIPVLKDDVSAYDNNMSIKNGYEKMFDQLNKDIEAMSAASNAEVDALMDKGMDQFARTMAKENMKGLSMMSMPAVYVQKILVAYLKKWTEDYTRQYDSLKVQINIKKKEMTKSADDDKCKDYERRDNEFMTYANPLIRDFNVQRMEAFRVWLNAFCTWSWYITGNPKNVVLTQCITWTNALVELYRSAVSDQVAIARTCVMQNGKDTASIAPPLIPNFTCPPVVSIPIGLDEIRLSAGAMNFDNNSWNIKQAEGMAMPNVTLTFGMDKNDIAEAGKYGNPYVKTGNGSANSSGIGNDDEDQLTPLPNLKDKLTPLSKIPPDELTPLDPRLLDTDKKLTSLDMKKIRQAELARKLLKEAMSTKCPGELPDKNNRKKIFEVRLGKLEMDDVWDEERGAWIDPDGNPRPPLVLSLGKLEVYEWDDDVKAWFNEKGEQLDENFRGTGLGKPTFEEVVENGPQPVINNGLGMMGKAIGFIKGLFN
ncbi:MAG: tetratricopeptide repeat protein [Flavisolibacter sp.]